jgi:protein-disulfide isomerase
MKMKLVLSLFCALALSVTTFGVGTANAQKLSQEEFDKMMGTFLEKDANVEKLGNALETLFRKKREAQQKAAALDQEKQLEEQFKNPVKVDAGDSPVKGPKSAKVTIIEFSDFQCPYCKRGAERMDEVLKAYPNDVKLVFKNLPLPFHPEAKPSAIAALAAGKQGKFWEMHDALFNNQGALGEKLYDRLAKELGLDLAKFKKDLADPKIAKMVDEDAALATKLGIRGTPGFFVNGVQVRGAQPLPKFKEIIDRWLSMKK